ncbi:hypothetical protein C8R46DRAFT_1352216 [Mycena filopes]|nr:hypothetical protein C8R46DRAFT_1352216 [Mycena filopes]
MSPSSLSALQLLVDATLPVFPTGCTVDTAHNATLALCCATVGSTPTQVAGVFGCPYTAAFAPAANQSFGSCALQSGAGSSCAPADSTADARQLRWNASRLAVGLVLAGMFVSLVQL